MLLDLATYTTVLVLVDLPLELVVKLLVVGAKVWMVDHDAASRVQVKLKMIDVTVGDQWNTPSSQQLDL